MEEHKSERAKRFALAQGWKSTVVPDLSPFEKSGNPKDIVWTLYAIREKESIKVVWTGDLFTSSVYKYGSYELHPARIGSVLRLLEGKPDPSKLNGSGGRLAQEDVSVYRNVDWDDETPAFDILVRVLGKEIVWAKTNGEIVSEMCPKDSNLGKPHFRVYSSKEGKRILEWCNPFGFQACYVNNVLEVN